MEKFMTFACLVLFSFFIIILSGCGTTLYLRYDPVSEVHPLKGENKPKIFISKIHDLEADVRIPDESLGRAVVEPPLGEGFKSALLAEFGRLGIPVVNNRDQSNAILEATLGSAIIYYSFSGGGGSGLTCAEFPFSLKLSDHKGDVIWKKNITGSGKVKLITGFSDSKRLSPALNAAMADGLGSIGPIFESEQVFARIYGIPLKSKPIFQADADLKDTKLLTALHDRNLDIDEPAIRITEHPDDYAVVIGIEHYSHDLPAAVFAERDARAVKNNLLAIGYPERNIKLLIDQRATLSGLASYLEEWLPRNVVQSSRVFFYFSGHGAPSESGQAFLVPWDGDPNYLNKSAYSLKKLYAQLSALKAKQVIVVLDSCFSGNGERSVLAEGARPLVMNIDTSISSKDKIILFTATSSKQVTATLKEQRHGIFTYYFLRGLLGDGRNNDGVVTARSLFEYLKPKVQDAANRQNRDQTPTFEGNAAAEITVFR